MMEEGSGGGVLIVPSSFLVGDPPLPCGQHVVERISADAGPGETNQSRAP